MAIQRFRFALSAALLGAALLFSAPRAHAEDGPAAGDGASIEDQIKAQIEKIVKLMRENEAALLAASQGSGKRPVGPDVKVPDPSSAGAKSSDADAPPALKGEDARRRMDDLLKRARASSTAIPTEIEELLRMIPC